MCSRQDHTVDLNMRNVSENGSGKRRYRHRPKPDKNAPERPYSAYVNFSNHTRERLKDQNLTFIEVSRIVGARWQTLPRTEKEAWKRQASKLLRDYKVALAKYQLSESHQRHKEYVGKFKKAQAAKKHDRVQNGILPPSILNDSEEHELVESSATSRTNSLSWSTSFSAINPSNISSANTPHGTTAPRPHMPPSISNGSTITFGGVLHCNLENTESYVERLWKKLDSYEGLLVRVLPKLGSADQDAIQKSILMSPIKRNHGNGNGMSGTSETTSFNSNIAIDSDWRSLPPDASSQKVDEDNANFYNVDNKSPRSAVSLHVSPLHMHRPSIAMSRMSSSPQDFCMLDSPSFASPTIPQRQPSLAIQLSPSNNVKPPPLSDYYAVDNLDAYNYGLSHADLYPGPLPLDHNYSDTPTASISLIDCGNPYLDPSLFPSSSNISHLRHERLM